MFIYTGGNKTTGRNTRGGKFHTTHKHGGGGNEDDDEC